MVIKKLKVRLSQDEIKTIKDLANEIFGKCEVYIFGSAKLENILDKPVDIVISKDKTRPIEREALKGIKL